MKTHHDDRLRLCATMISALVLLAGNARGLLFYDLDNSANTSDPGTGVPFDAVARVTTTTNPTQLSHLRGSAVHLGNGYMLTANHVATDPNDMVSFDGSVWYGIDSNFSPQQVAANVDLKVFRLDAVPSGISAAGIYTGTSENTGPATIVGWGLGRGNTPLESAVVSWGNHATANKRWGINNPVGLVGVGYQSGGYVAIYTELDPLTGTNQAAVIDKDSGSPMFQFLDGAWRVIGIATAVTRNSGAGTSTFGTENMDENYFVRVSAYSDQILVLIPEPAPVVLLGIFGLAALLRVLGGRNVKK